MKVPSHYVIATFQLYGSLMLESPDSFFRVRETGRLRQTRLVIAILCVVMSNTEYIFIEVATSVGQLQSCLCLGSSPVPGGKHFLQQVKHAKGLMVKYKQNIFIGSRAVPLQDLRMGGVCQPRT